MIAGADESIVATICWSLSKQSRRPIGLAQRAPPAVTRAFQFGQRKVSIRFGDLVNLALVR